MPARMKLTHEFVEFLPEKLQEGVLYISIAYATAAHKCCCGCGHEVVTPLTPTDWKLIFDGETVTLDPSIGNWSFPCKSHYWIRRNSVQWADRWSPELIQAGREQDAIRKGRPSGTSKQEVPSVVAPPLPQPVARQASGWDKVRRWFLGG